MIRALLYDTTLAMSLLSALTEQTVQTVPTTLCRRPVHSNCDRSIPNWRIRYDITLAVA